MLAKYNLNFLINSICLILLLFENKHLRFEMNKHITKKGLQFVSFGVKS